MNEQYKQQSPGGRESVTRPQSGFTVSASPFNVVKLELGIILCVAIVLLLVVERISSQFPVQLGLLFLYGLGAMVWLLWRTRKIVQGLHEESARNKDV